MRPKVTVVGRGERALASVARLRESGLFDVAAYNSVIGGNGGGVFSHDPVAASGSRVLVLVPGGAGSNDELLDTVARDLTAVLPLSSDPLILVADSLSTALCEIARNVSGVPSHRVIGTGTLPDSARLQALIAAELGIAVQSVEALAVGEPGSAALPLVRFATAAGVPVLDLLEADRIGVLLDRFREPGRSNGPAPDSPDRDPHVDAVVRIVNAVTLGPVDLVPCTVMLGGEYGLHDVYLSVPAVLGAAGVQRIVELDLGMDELLPLRMVASEVRSVTVRASG